MPELSPIAGQAQNQQQRVLPTLLQTQNIIMTQTQELEERIDIELMQNPALYLDNPLVEDDEMLDLQGENEDYWNDDFDKPIDECETGDRYIEDTYDLNSKISALESIAVNQWNDEHERLKKAIKAIDDYRHSGIMSDDMLRDNLIELEALPQNQKLFSKRPDIKVTTDNGQVEAWIVSNKGDYLKYNNGMGINTIRAQAFIKDIQHRKRVLQKLCDLVLTELQKDFFMEQNASAAWLNLLPIPVSILCDLITDELFKTNLSLKKFIYKSENLIVSCGHGNFPFNLFFPNEPPILRLWMSEAARNGKIRQEEQRKWIKAQIEKRVSAWSPADRRLDFLQPLINISIDNIKYAKKKAKHEKIKKG